MQPQGKRGPVPFGLPTWKAQRHQISRCDGMQHEIGEIEFEGNEGEGIVCI